jgi:uncharacterized protein YcbX
MKKVSALYIYPVKSLGGIALNSSPVLPKGLQYDRRWMLVDENNQFLTQRVHPAMAMFKTTLHVDGIKVSYKEEGEIIIPFQSSGELLQATVWNDEVQVHEVGKLHNDWFSALLGMKCKLVQFPDSHVRKVDPDFALNDDETSLSDGYPVLVISQASLDDLNSRLQQAVSINRFRPNIVVEGSVAFDEDNWKMFSLGSAKFAGVKPCARCVMTTVDQETATKGEEPLRTLSTYRKMGNKVMFGQNLLVMQPGNISVGDEIVF